jgi:hypothetical protein
MLRCPERKVKEMTFLLLLSDVFPLRSLPYAGAFRNSGLLYWLAFIGLRKANLACSPFIIARLSELDCSILRHDKKDLRFDEYHDLPMTITTQPRDVVASHHPSNSLPQLSRFPARFETQVSRSASASVAFSPFAASGCVKTVRTATSAAGRRL